METETNIISETIAQSEKWALPLMTDEIFTELVRNSKRGLKEEYVEALDELSIWWRQYEPKRQLMLRFNSLVNSPSLFPLEKERIQKEYKEIEDSFEDTYKMLHKFVADKNIDFSLVDSSSYTLSFIDTKLEDNDETIIEVGEALLKAKDKGLSANEVRQRVAQSSFVELLSTIQAQNLAHAAESDIRPEIEDSPEMEGEAVANSFEYPSWTSEEKRKYRKIYNKWDKDAKKYFSNKVGENIELLWKCAIGKIPPKISVFDILETEWFIFKALKRQGGMEFHLEE